MSSHYLNSGLLQLLKMLWFFKAVQVCLIEKNPLSAQVYSPLSQGAIYCLWAPGESTRILEQVWQHWQLWHHSHDFPFSRTFSIHCLSGATFPCSILDCNREVCRKWGCWKTSKGSSARAFISCTFRNQRCISLIQRIRTAFISKRTGYLF